MTTQLGDFRSSVALVSALASMLDDSVAHSGDESGIRDEDGGNANFGNVTKAADEFTRSERMVSMPRPNARPELILNL